MHQLADGNDRLVGVLIRNCFVLERIEVVDMIKERFNNGRLPLLRLNCDGVAQGKSLLGIFDKHLTSPCLDGRQAPTKSDCVRSTLHSPPTNRR